METWRQVAGTSVIDTDHLNNLFYPLMSENLYDKVTEIKNVSKTFSVTSAKFLSHGQNQIFLLKDSEFWLESFELNFPPNEDLYIFLGSEIQIKRIFPLNIPK